MADALTQYRLLGRSGLRVSPMSLGTMTFGLGLGWGSEDDEAKRMVDLYMDRGGNFIDTANYYGQGGSEKLLGEALTGKRDRAVVATKYSLMMGEGDPNATGNQRKNMVRAVEDSLKRLNTDYIDLFYLHVWDHRTPVEEILRAFDDLVRAGKILYTGISDTPAWQISRMQAIADLRGWTPLVALQLLHNLADRDAEADLIPMAREMGLGVTVWGPLASGVLTGKYSRADLDAPLEGSPTDSRKNLAKASGRLSEKTLAIGDEVKKVAEELNCEPSQVALAWVLRQKGLASLLIGARTAKQLEDNLGALDVTLSDEQAARLESIAPFEPGFPHSFLKGPAYDGMFGNLNVARR